jgi:nucleoside-diphosphate-sugar epimerase
MRQFNCIGPRETHDYVVPEIISQLAKEPIVHLGNNSTRDFQSSYDAVRNAVLLLEMGEFGEVYNMGSEHCTTIYDLAYMIGRLMWGTDDIEIVNDKSRERPWEIWHLQSDNTKLRSVIGDQPVTSLRTALLETIAYFHTNGGWDF